jgi:hypothetical protein
MTRRVKTRDHFMLSILTGATKAGVHRDSRKHLNKGSCRGTNKMYAARKALSYDIVFEWTRDGEHGELEVFDIYAKQTDTGYEIVGANIVDTDGETVTFNLSSFSDEEMIALRNAAADEWEFSRTVQ